MPRQSSRKDALEKINLFVLQVIEKRLKTLRQWDPEDISDGEDSGSEDFDAPVILSPFSPVTPITPITLIASQISSSGLSDDSSDLSDDSVAFYMQQDAQHQRLLGAISALHDEVLRARVLNRVSVPMMRASQLPLLDHFADHRPHLFRKKLRVDPEIFDRILEQISGSDIFIPKGNQPQLPISIQLAIFLNRAGHYGNAISLEDIAQWAGVSVGSVNNCTNRVMVALLQQHDLFLGIPGEEEAEIARDWVEERSCPGWRNGIFAADGSAINLFEKPGVYGETFYDRKSRYSLNCQVR